MFAFRISSPVVEHASVVIHRSPEAVFRFVGEQFFTNYPRWSPEVQELRQIGSGPVKAGTRASSARRSGASVRVDICRYRLRARSAGLLRGRVEPLPLRLRDQRGFRSSFDIDLLYLRTLEPRDVPAAR